MYKISMTAYLEMFELSDFFPLFAAPQLNALLMERREEGSSRRPHDSEVGKVLTFEKYSVFLETVKVHVDFAAIFECHNELVAAVRLEKVIAEVAV